MLHFTSKSTWTKVLSLSLPQACNHSAQDSGGDWQVAREPIQRAGRLLSQVMRQLHLFPGTSLQLTPGWCPFPSPLLLPSLPGNTEEPEKYKSVHGGNVSQEQKNRLVQPHRPEPA